MTSKVDDALAIRELYPVNLFKILVWVSSRVVELDLKVLFPPPIENTKDL